VAASEGKSGQSSAGAQLVLLELAPARFEFRARLLPQSLKNIGAVRVEIHESELN